MSDNKIKRSQHEIRSADDKILAYNYQWDFFVLQVLKLVEENDVVSFEYLDDVAKESNDLVILYQVKHSVKKGADGKIVNLTDRDNDIWKTIFVWMQFIDENNDSRNSYLEKTEFVLITNKTESDNKFISALRNYAKDENINNFKESIKIILGKGKENSINTNIINQFLSLDYLELFINKIRLNLNEIDLQAQIKDLIKNRFALQISKVDEVFDRLMSRMRTDADSTIRKGEKVIYDISTIQKNYWTIISVGREKLVFKTDYPSYNGDPRDLMFIKQLLAVNEVAKNDLDFIAQYTKEWFQFHNNLKDKWVNHDINDLDIFQLTNDVKSIWIRERKQHFKNRTNVSPQEELDKIAQDFIYKIRSEPLYFGKTSMGPVLSNGCFYYYSNDDVEIIPDLPMIGWHINWENIFKHHE